MIYRFGFAQFRAKAALQSPLSLLRPVLGEAAISVLRPPELLLEHPEGMFDRGLTIAMIRSMSTSTGCSAPLFGDGPYEIALFVFSSIPDRLTAVLVIVGLFGDGLKWANSPDRILR
jgi:hypothetical protein